MVYGIIKATFLNLFRRHISLHPVQNFEHGVRMKIRGNGRLFIGKGCHILRNSTLFADEGIIRIGNGVFINENVKIVAHDEIVIGDRCSIGPNVMVFDHDHDYRKESGFKSDKIIIGEGAWIGANVVILKGCKIGKNAVIAAGSVIYEDIGDKCVIYQKIVYVVKKYSEGIN